VLLDAEFSNISHTAKVNAQWQLVRFGTAASVKVALAMMVTQNTSSAFFSKRQSKQAIVSELCFQAIMSCAEALVLSGGNFDVPKVFQTADLTLANAVPRWFFIRDKSYHL